MQVDLPRFEAELFRGDAAGQIESKLTRIDGILNEFEADSWLARQLKEYDAELLPKLKAVKASLEEMRKK